MATTNNKQKHSWRLRFFVKARHKVVFLLETISAAFWLGLLRRDDFYYIDESYYSKQKMYSDKKHNLQGLFSWEKKAIEDYFINSPHLLVGAVGGGREVIALHKMGYLVDSFECHQGLVEEANALLKEEGITAKVQLVCRDACLESENSFDGVIFGWGAYSLIQGRQTRTRFLKQIRKQIRANSPALFSFIVRKKTSVHHKIIFFLGNLIRLILFRRDYLELGDDLCPHFAHFFNEEEIRAEMKSGGFTVKYFETSPYGHLVALAV